MIRHLLSLGASLLVVSLTVDARAEERFNRFSTSATLGWMHTSVFDVPIDAGAASFGIGFTHQRPHGFGIDVHGTIGARVGRTAQGRTVSGFAPVGLVAVFHYDWVRLGLGAGVGSFGVTRSTNDESQSYVLSDFHASVGVEPFAVSGRPLFVGVQLHRLIWDEQPMNAFTLAVGARFCGEGCMP